VSWVQCEHPECAVEATAKCAIISPFGSPIVCTEHAIELLRAADSESPDTRAAAWRWVAEVMRFGPGDAFERMRWLREGGLGAAIEPVAP
jgi:hypothetical protein